MLIERRCHPRDRNPLLASTHVARFVPMVDLLDDADLADAGVHLNDSRYDKLEIRVLAELGLRATR